MIPSLPVNKTDSFRFHVGARQTLFNERMIRNSQIVKSRKKAAPLMEDRLKVEELVAKHRALRVALWRLCSFAGFGL